MNALQMAHLLLAHMSCGSRFGHYAASHGIGHMRVTVTPRGSGRWLVKLACWVTKR